jgi:hypothetical protein
MTVHSFSMRKRRKALLKTLKNIEINLKNMQLCMSVLNDGSTTDSRLKHIANELNYIRSEYSNRIKQIRDELDRISDLVEKESEE